MLPILTDLRHARVMRATLEDLVEEGNYCKVGSLPPYLLYTSMGFLYELWGYYDMKLTRVGKIFLIMQAFQVLSEYLQLLDSLSEFSAAQEMTRGVEVVMAYS